ncbi:MAG: hypothetical protein U0572_00335 [Phycisphaerales bacterium]
MIVVLGTVTAALLMHFSFCFWSFGGILPSPAVFAYTVPSQSPSQAPRAYGMYTRGGLPSPVCAVFGVVVPVCLSFLLAYRIARWRELDRVAQGRCSACGYQKVSAVRCPECGRIAQASGGSG